jgi:hypothetical protein
MSHSARLGKLEAVLTVTPMDRGSHCRDCGGLRVEEALHAHHTRALGGNRMTLEEADAVYTAFDAGEDTCRRCGELTLVAPFGSTHLVSGPPGVSSEARTAAREARGHDHGAGRRERRSLPEMRRPSARDIDAGVGGAGRSGPGGDRQPWRGRGRPKCPRCPLPPLWSADPAGPAHGRDAEVARWGAPPRGRVTPLRWATLSGNRVLDLHQAGVGYRLSVVVLDGPPRTASAILGT